jgi:hypothetical protein
LKVVPQFTFGLCSTWLTLLIAGPAIGVQPSDTLLPRTTKGYVSVAKPAEFEERWQETQFGQMLNDEVMRPFVDDLRAQLEDKYHALEDKLGLAWNDLEGVPAGELSLAVVERQGSDAALAITIDVTGRLQQAEALLAAVEKRFIARGGRSQTADSGGATLHVYTVPGDAGSPPQVTVYFIEDDMLCGIDDRAEAEAMLRRFSGDAEDSLQSVAAYAAVMDRCRQEAADLEPEARWFVEPFGFIFAVQSLREASSRRYDLEYAKIFQEQGFDAIQGIGGFVNQLVDGNIEILHRTAVHAPPIREQDPLRWSRSMRMLQTPNVEAFEPQSWVPRMIASYTTFNLRLADAFDNVGPLFDALQEHQNAWKNTLDGWENDPYGPQVNVRTEFIDNLADRFSIVTDYSTPIGTESERAIFAIEATDEQALSAALEKWMTREPEWVRRNVGQFVVWERVPQDHAVKEPEVEVPGFAPLQSDRNDDAKRDNEELERVLPNSAVTVALGQLMMASDIDYLQEILAGFGQRERLASSLDYQQALESLNRVAPGAHCALHFGRTDEEMRPTFELVRQGRMPESKTMFGKFLNNMLTTEEQRADGELREQRIDGSTLPSFEAVRRYFGPHGRVTRSEQNGWFMTGVVLNKQAP